MPGGKARLCGDVRSEEWSRSPVPLTPVPGGVGPMTVTMLLVNAVARWCRLLLAEISPWRRPAHP